VKKNIQNSIKRLKSTYHENKFFSLFLVVLWLALSFITSYKDVLYFSLDVESSIPTLALYTKGFLLWTIVLCFVPIILLLARRYPIDDKGIKWNYIPHHLFFCICFLFLVALSFTIIFGLFYWDDVPFTQSLLGVMYWNNLGIPVAYWFIIGGLVLQRNSNLYNKRKQRAVALQSELKQIQLNVLQMQLRPHFLFNALNTVNALIYENNEVALNMLEKIKKYLELSFNENDKIEIKLQEEIYFTKLYLDIEKERYSDRLHIELNFDPDIKTALVPNMILQPLVENAVHHGIANKPGPGKLTICARQEKNTIVLEIEDSGKGFNLFETKKMEGLGINITRKRLNKLYPHNYDFNISRSDLGGCKVRIIIPLRFRKQGGQISQDLIEMNHH
jgi:two-component system, LytTR family, sensor kinase